MSDPAFGTAPTFSSEDPLDLAVSPDGQALTITFLGLEALVDASTAAPIAIRVASIALPVEGFDEGVQVAVRIDGFAFVTDGAAAAAVVVVNGKAGAAPAVPGADNDFVHEVVARGTGTAECRMSVVLVTERDSGNRDAVARLDVSTLDAEITRSPGGDPATAS